jgi:hypothetical protein
MAVSRTRCLAQPDPDAHGPASAAPRAFLPPAIVPPKEGTRMLGLFRRSVYRVIRGGNLVRRLLPALLRSVQLTTMGVLLALVAGWGAREVSRILASPTPAVSCTRMSALATADAEALSRCERSLREARRRMREDPEDGSACLEVASLEMRRGDWLALLAEETRSHTSDGATGPESRVNPQWRQYYLRGDPAGTLRRAAQAAEAALRVLLASPSRRRALLLLAATRAAQGNYHGEAEALAEAVRREPGEAWLWLRLSEAYGRAHRFARAAEARELGLSLPGGNCQELTHPGAGVPQNAADKTLHSPRQCGSRSTRTRPRAAWGCPPVSEWCSVRAAANRRNHRLVAAWHGKLRSSTVIT